MIVHPGDYLFIPIRQDYTVQDADDLGKMLKERMPDVTITVINSIDQAFIYRPIPGEFE